jgi:small subunit ribosomal protein S21
MYEEKPAHGKKGTMVKVYNGNIEGAITQLKRKSNLEGINKELRRRRYFETNTAKRRRMLAEAQLRWKKKWDLINEAPKAKRKPKKNVRPRTAVAKTSD